MKYALCRPSDERLSNNELFFVESNKVKIQGSLAHGRGPHVGVPYTFKKNWKNSFNLYLKWRVTKCLLNQNLQRKF